MDRRRPGMAVRRGLPAESSGRTDARGVGTAFFPGGGRLGDELTGPRTLGYLVLRVCERLALREAEFDAATRADQLRWLGYERLRLKEEAAARAGER